MLRGVILALGIFDEPAGRYRIVVRDTAGDPARAAHSVRDLADDGVRVVIGPMRSSVAVEAVSHADRARIPVLSLARREGLQELSDYVFRLGLSGSDQVSMLAEHSVRQGGAQRFAILYPRDDYGSDYKDRFWDEVERETEVFDWYDFVEFLEADSLSIPICSEFEEELRGRRRQFVRTRYSQ